MDFWDREWVQAAIDVSIALAIALIIDRFVIGRATKVAARVGESSPLSVSRGAATRLRLIRRLVFVTIVLIGLFLALGEFTKLNRLATGLLASSAVLGIVLGLAARQLLANPMAGILLSISQPIRIGDTVTIADETGRVDDLTLSHTFLDTGDGRLVIVPNETVITSVIVNRSTGDLSAPAVVSLWVPPATDLAAAKAALEVLEPSSVEVAETVPWGVRLEVHGPRRPAGTRGGSEEAALRERAHRALREAGLLDV